MPSVPLWEPKGADTAIKHVRVALACHNWGLHRDHLCCPSRQPEKSTFSAMLHPRGVPAEKSPAERVPVSSSTKKDADTNRHQFRKLTSSLGRALHPGALKSPFWAGPVRRAQCTRETSLRRNFASFHLRKEPKFHHGK